MDLLKGIDALFKLDVIRWKLSLHHISSASVFSGDGMKASHTLSSACPNCSFRYCWVRPAKGEMDALMKSAEGF